MIEHDMEFISRLRDPVIVMAEGGVLAQGLLKMCAITKTYRGLFGIGLKNR